MKHEEAWPFNAPVDVKESDPQWKEFVCEKCDYATYSRYQLGAHVKRIHEQIKDCDQCAFTAWEGYELRKHKKKVHEKEPKPLKAKPEGSTKHCYMCGFTTVNRDELKDHLKTIHNVEPLIFFSN